MKRDIEDRADIEMMLHGFYQKVLKDDLIAYFFIEVVPLNLEHHLPLITDFWASVLLHQQGYRKNVLELHAAINQQSPMEKEHFDRWVNLFTETVDTMFEGPIATLAKQRARSIATMMQIKLSGSNPLKQ